MPFHLAHSSSRVTAALINPHRSEYVLFRHHRFNSREHDRWSSMVEAFWFHSTNLQWTSLKCSRNGRAYWYEYNDKEKKYGLSLKLVSQIGVFFGRFGIDFSLARISACSTEMIDSWSLWIIWTEGNSRTLYVFLWVMMTSIRKVDKILILILTHESCTLKEFHFHAEGSKDETAGIYIISELISSY